MTSEADETHVERDEPSISESEPPVGVVVPWDRLSGDALRGVIEEYITREGTEYGADDVPLERKIAQVRTQLEAGEVVVLFDAGTESVNLVRAADVAKS